MPTGPSTSHSINTFRIISIISIILDHSLHGFVWGPVDSRRLSGWNFLDWVTPPRCLDHFSLSNCRIWFGDSSFSCELYEPASCLMRETCQNVHDLRLFNIFVQYLRSICSFNMFVQYVCSVCQYVSMIFDSGHHFCHAVVTCFHDAALRSKPSLHAADYVAACHEILATFWHFPGVIPWVIEHVILYCTRMFYTVIQSRIYMNI